MLIAAARQFPAWMVQAGLIRFYGQDIDATCVKMAPCNTILHGMNGTAIQWALALSDAEIASIPERALRQRLHRGQGRPLSRRHRNR